VSQSAVVRVFEYLAARPLALFAPALLAGVAGAAQASLPAAWVGAGLGAGVAAVAAAALLRRGASVAAVLLGVACGAARQEWWERVPATDVSGAVLSEDRVRVRGVVRERPRVYRDRSAALGDARDGHDERASAAFALDIESIDRLPGVTGRVRVHVYDRDPALVGGEVLLLEGRLRLPRPRTNPGGTDRRAVLAREGIGALLIVGAKDEFRVVSPAPIMSMRTTIEGVRDVLRERFQAHARPDAAAMMSALVIGTRENLPEPLVASLQRSGTAHFLAISGQNMALVLGIVMSCLAVAGLRGPKQQIVTLALLLAYTALSGWQVSVVRAFLMAAFWISAGLVWRKADSFNAMCAAAAIIVLADPTELFQPGFQLSFLAVVGIILVAPVFHEFTAPPDRPDPTWTQRLAASARGVLAISMAAWLTTAPVVLSTFNLLTPVILVANLVLVPLIMVEMILGLALLVVAPVVPPLADALGWCAGLTLDAIAGSSDVMTRLPGSYLFLPALPGGAVAAYYGLLALWTLWARAASSRVRPWFCAVFALMLAAPALVRTRVDGLFVAMLDVGRGSATYVEWADGRNLVYDCGSLNVRDAGATVMAPYLWSRGVRQVDTLVLSHPDADHVNGAWSVVERMRVRRLVVTRRMPEAFVAEARARGLDVIIVERTGAEPAALAPGVEVLGPAPPERLGRNTPDNDTSIVLRLDGRVLLTGDIEERGSLELLSLGGAVRAEVLVVPHHGKRHALHRVLADAVAPTAALVSAPDGYSAPEVLAHLERTCGVYRTGRDGCVEVTARPEGLEIRTFLGR